MNLLELLLLLLIAGVCGALGQSIAGFKRGGFLAAIVLGFVGAMLGVWLARNLDLPEIFAIQLGDVNFPIIWSIIGATLFVAVIGLIARSSRS